MGLLDYFFGGSKPQPQQPQQPQQQGGLLAPVVNQKAYRDYVIDMQSNGKAPLPYADWAKMQAQQPQK